MLWFRVYTKPYNRAHYTGVETHGNTLHSTLMSAEEAEEIATDTLSKLMLLNCMYLVNVL